ncbi:Oxoglutarate/iron-dependent dioxygenase [Sesbania bispinosa]|nr:Oxoglutarate/iron-dependent dioxygenase [Sesbania bispinosa]
MALDPATQREEDDFLINVGHIDDVQELTKTKLRIIPERFVRDVTERPSLAKPLPPSPADMPVIDFSKLTAGNGEEIQSEILKLAAACEQWGFFQVLNHGIDLNLMDSMENTGREFFMLPLEEKQKYSLTPGSVQGYGQAFVFSEDQKLDWCSMFALGIEPQCVRCPHLWPEKPARFSETVEVYSREVRKLCQSILKYIALGLGLEGDVFEKMFGVAMQALRMNYYPPCPRPDLVLGISPHSDGGTLTVLQQAKGSPVGLQVLKDKTWVPVQPIPGALLINIGDTMEVLTNGKYKSVEHRAVAHQEKDRLSIVSFYAPNHGVDLSPMPEFVDENNPCKFRRYNYGDYARHYITNKLEGKKTLDFAKM